MIKACPLQRFADRRVIVTGAGSGIGIGIGQATVARILDEGATVVAYDVSSEGLAHTATVAEEAGTGALLTTAVLDVSSEDAVAAAVSAVLAELGGLEVLVGDPSAVASVIAMVASDDGAFITGTEIRIDGGAHA
jgi:NAD(P)-dependent dehydrogenase (short-subunit alcohol dehydrogenase family)